MAGRSRTLALVAALVVVQLAATVQVRDARRWATPTIALR